MIRLVPRTGLLLAPLTLLALGCTDEGPSGLQSPPRTAPEAATLVLETSSETPSAGDIVRVRLRVGEGGGEGGVAGTLRWDREGLEWLGQLPESERAVVVDRDRGEDGRLRFVSLDPRGRGGSAGIHVFRVLQPGGLGTLDAVLTDVVSTDGRRWAPPTRVVRAVNPEVPVGDPVQWEWQDWATTLDPNFQPDAAGPARVPGEGDVFGDATLDGRVNVLDGLYAANVSVGNTAVAECILGTDAPSRDCIAINVRPANLPGLGEPADDCPPGLDDCGGAARTINVIDVLAISRESVGIDEAVVGEAIPVPPVPADTVELVGPVTGARTLSSDSVYRVPATLIVGDEAGGTAGELRIEAGARIAVAPGAAIHVSRNGRIFAEGGPFQPIRFDCDVPSPSPGCWRGLVVSGNATVNRGVPRAGDGFRGGPGGCLERVDDAPAYGGCEDADSSGVLRRVYLLNAGAEGGALELRGVGFGTVIENVFVSGSGAEGVHVRGGTVDLRNVRILDPAIRGLGWQEGWRGRFQFGVVQAGATTMEAIRGGNLASDPDAEPRSAPHVRNLTLVGSPVVGTSPVGAGGIVLETGTAGTLASLLVVGQPAVRTWALDINGEETWARAVTQGDLSIEGSVFAGYGRLGNLDVDPGDLGDLVSPDAEGQLLLRGPAGNLFFAEFDNLELVLRGAWASVPDLRPVPFGAAARASCPEIAGDGFFEPVSFCGAVDPPESSLGEIPWFEPSPRFDATPTPSTEAIGLLRYAVTSPQLGPIPGVSLEGAPRGITGLDGIYRSYVPADGLLVRLRGVPAECNAPELTESFFFLLGPGEGEVFNTGAEIECTGTPEPARGR